MLHQLTLSLHQMLIGIFLCAFLMSFSFDRGSQSSSADNMEEWVSMDPGTGRGHVMNLGQMEAFVTHTPHRYT